MQFEPGYPAPASPNGPAYWFAFAEGDIVVRECDSQVMIPVAHDLAELGLASEHRQFLGWLNRQPCHAVDLGPAPTLVAPLRRCGLRSLFEGFDPDLFGVASRALHLVYWDRTHRYCGCCGGRVEPHASERAKLCRGCGHIVYPRIAPAVIVAVTRAGRLLLARRAQRPGRMFSIIAGFVEAGESLEQAVVREVREEVGLEVGNIRYFGSQPWPYPDSLMLGFTADYAGGEIRVDGVELAEADWFGPDALPEIPSRISISRALIDHFVAAARTRC